MERDKMLNSIPFWREKCENRILTNNPELSLEQCEEIESALMEGVWLMRWNKEKTSMSAVLQAVEAHKICSEVIEELDKAGYKIVKKE